MLWLFHKDLSRLRQRPPVTTAMSSHSIINNKHSLAFRDNVLMPGCRVPQSIPFSSLKDQVQDCSLPQQVMVAVSRRRKARDFVNCRITHRKFFPSNVFHIWSNMSIHAIGFVSFPVHFLLVTLREIIWMSCLLLRVCPSHLFGCLSLPSSPWLVISVEISQRVPNLFKHTRQF